MVVRVPGTEDKGVGHNDEPGRDKDVIQSILVNNHQSEETAMTKTTKGMYLVGGDGFLILDRVV